MARHKTGLQSPLQAVALRAESSPAFPAGAIASLGVLAIISLWLLTL
jgi:hypothetical protein